MQHPDFPDIDYTPPADASQPPSSSIINIVKSGQIQSILTPSQSTSTIGRLPTSDIHFEHPSISRTHAILQFTDSGASLFDLGSTHGTFINRKRLDPRVHVGIKANDVIQFGSSTRFFVFNPLKPVAVKEKVEEVREMSWGQRDAGEIQQGNEVVENPDATYRNKPARALKRWATENDVTLNFDTEEEGMKGLKSFTVRLKLFVEGQEIVCEGNGDKRKEAHTECCLDACGKLDKLGLLNENSVASAQPKQKGVFEEDSDDDFFDMTKKTGSSGVDSSTAETYESLSKKREYWKRQIVQVESELLECRAKMNVGDGEEEDDLDAYLNNLASGLAKEQQLLLETQLAQHKADVEQADKLLELIRPQTISSFKDTVAKPVVAAPVVDVVANSTKKRKEADSNEDDVFKKPEDMAPPAGVKRRMVASVQRKEEAVEQSRMEGDVEEWVAPMDQQKSKKEMKAAMSKYGY